MLVASTSSGATHTCRHFEKRPQRPLHSKRLVWIGVRCVYAGELLIFQGDLGKRVSDVRKAIASI